MSSRRLKMTKLLYARLSSRNSLSSLWCDLILLGSTAYDSTVLSLQMSVDCTHVSKVRAVDGKFENSGMAA